MYIHLYRERGCIIMCGPYNRCIEVPHAAVLVLERLLLSRQGPVFLRNLWGYGVKLHV